MSKANKKQQRVPFTREQLEKLSVYELADLKLSEEEIRLLREINDERQQRNMERGGRLQVEEGPIIKDLHEVGWNVKSIWDLVNTSAKYPEAVPVLLKHLLMPYSDRTRAGLARALAVREAQYAWPILVAQYQKAPEGEGFVAPGDNEVLGFWAKDGLACALSATVSDETLGELIDLLRDRSNGESRILLLPALKKRRRKNPMAKQAIEELADDPDLKKEIASWKK